MTAEKRKGIKETFAGFFENPSRESLRKLLIDHTGEDNDLEFKSEIISSAILAKHILAMANKSGGAIIFGVQEIENTKFEPVGIKLNDKTNFLRDINVYLPEKLKYEVFDFSFEETEYSKIKGKCFRVVIVEYTPEYIPFMSKKDGEVIRRNSVYIRHNASTIQAEYTQLQDILNRRIETSFSSAREISLIEHFKELKDIYSSLSPGQWYPAYDEIPPEVEEYLDKGYTFVSNSNYPEEDYEEFVLRMIKLKKLVIESIVKSHKYMR